MIWSRRVAAALCLLVLCAMPAPAAAQLGWDPAGTVEAYSAALNTHDVASALSLFDEYGSAGVSSGHHFEGQAGLTEFLLGNGFGNPDARITTRSLAVVANRALWTYTCTCSDGSTDVRIVLTDQNKISVFAIMAPPAKPVRRADAGVLPWLLGLGLLAGVSAGGLGMWRGRYAPVPRATQGRLLAALVQARAGQSYALGGGPDSERVELPAAAITSLRSSDDNAGPCSR